MTEEQTTIPMSTGEDLRQLREARGLSLEQAAERIRCPLRVLAAVEAGREPGIAPIYLKGHLGRYAELLELDAASTEALLAAHEGESPGVQTVFENRPRAQASDRWLRVASYVLGSLLVGTLAWQMTHEAVRLARVDAPAEHPADGAAVETDTHVNASIASLESLRGPAGSRTADAGAQAWKALEAARQAMADGGHLLELETSADTWVEITQGDGERLEQDLLRGGEARSYRGEGPFQVSLGRASAVRLLLDGDVVDLAPHTRDDVARLLLDPVEQVSDEPESGSGPDPE